MASQKVSKTPTIRRFPAYLRLLRLLERTGQETVSTTYFAQETGIEPILIRKDLTLTGIVGRPKAGFLVGPLIRAIEDYLGWSDTQKAFLIGAGNIGSALLGYEGFETYGLHILAAFDTNPSKIGGAIHGRTVHDLVALPVQVKKHRVRLGILTVPGKAAQNAADFMVKSGLSGIWNFTPVKLKLPQDIALQNEDLSSGLAELSVKMQRRG